MEKNGQQWRKSSCYPLWSPRASVGMIVKRKVPPIPVIESIIQPIAHQDAGY